MGRSGGSWDLDDTLGLAICDLMNYVLGPSESAALLCFLETSELGSLYLKVFNGIIKYWD